MAKRSFPEYFPAWAVLFAGMSVSVGAPAPLSAQAIPASTSSSAAAPTSPTTPSAPAPVAATAPAKHVWTNDDVTQLHGQSDISTVGRNVKAAKPGAAAAKPKPRTAAYYQEQIGRLQAQLPAMDQQIATLQEALSGKTVDETRKYAGVKLDDWHSELAALQTKRSSILEQIATLQDQARHDGIPASMLP
jgi:hypothetical protein